MSIVRELARRQAIASYRITRKDMEGLKVRLEREIAKGGDSDKLKRRLAEVEHELEHGSFSEG